MKSGWPLWIELQWIPHRNTDQVESIEYVHARRENMGVLDNYRRWARQCLTIGKFENSAIMELRKAKRTLEQFLPDQPAIKPYGVPGSKMIPELSKLSLSLSLCLYFLCFFFFLSLSLSLSPSFSRPSLSISLSLSLSTPLSFFLSLSLSIIFLLFKSVFGFPSLFLFHSLSVLQSIISLF